MTRLFDLFVDFLIRFCFSRIVRMLQQLAKPLFIAEKPDMGKKIAAQLPGPHKRGEGYIETGHGVVTWAIGHLLEQAQPQEYDPKYEKWNLQDLPIIPQTWKVKACGGKSKQISIIRTLLKTCSDVVNAGDPGREGQLIVDELLEFLNNKKPVWRLLLNSLDPATVQKAFTAIQTNQVFQPLYEAALGRQRADWVIGMNLTRAYTLVGRQQGYQGVLPVGRVQSPTLAITVRREEEIQKFVPQKYWSLAIALGSKPPFKARYAPPKGFEPVDEDADPAAAAAAAATSATGPRPTWLDDKGRICTFEQAQAIVGSVPLGSPAKVVDYAKTSVLEQPPLPFELSDMQSHMSAKHGASVQDVLDVCQKLYEDQYLSYPRTDSSYLKESQHVDAPQILAALAGAGPEWATLIKQADTSLKSHAWNDAKIPEHHAIIPTLSTPNLASLSDLERWVYEAASKRYLAQFFPPCEVDKVAVELEAGGHRWLARGRVITSPGWRLVYGQEADTDDEDEDEAASDDSGVLPAMAVGDVHPVAKISSDEKTTKPPPRYTEGTLMQVMKHVDRLVTDPTERKMLRTVQGIGRAATRANIIATLIKRGLLDKVKKQLVPSSAACVLINALDKNLIDPGLTARWEQALDGVAAGKISLATFQQKQEHWVHQLTAAAVASTLPTIVGGPVSSGGGGSKSGASKGKGKAATGKAFTPGKSFPPPVQATAAAVAAAGADPGPCPKCKKPMVQRTVRQGQHVGAVFWSCSGYPACNHSVWPKK
jgi:DNA topoisomerase-3